MLDFGSPKDIFLRFFGRTDLRIGASRAKKCKGLDFEVRSSVDPPKSAEKGAKNDRPFFFCSPKIEMSGIVWNAFWQSLTPIGAMFEGKRALTRRR